MFTRNDGETIILDHLQSTCVEAGMIEQEAKIFATFEELIGKCKRWISSSRDVGIPMAMKQHCKDQF